MAHIILLDFVTLLWKALGWNIYKTTNKTKLIIFIMFMEFMAMLTLGVMVPICTETNTNTLADAFEIVGPYYQLLIKMMMTQYSIKEISILLNTMKTSFWPADKFGPVLENQINLIDTFVTKLFKVFVCSAYGTCVIVCLRTWLTEDRIYPVSIYNFGHIDDNKHYVSMYIWLIITILLGCTTLIAVDGLFILFVTNIYCQFKLIKEAFLTLNIQNIKSSVEEEETYEKIKEYVNHHNLILTFTKDVASLFSLQILNQFIGNTASICMGTYIATMAGVEELPAAFKATTILLFIVLELILFCTAGTLITEASVQVSDCMWCSGWESVYSKRLRYATQMVVMRSQKRLALRAGKMFDIDLTSLEAVIKLSVSVYTLMNNVKNKKLE